MSLDIYLNKFVKKTNLFILDKKLEWKKRELTVEEIGEKFPNLCDDFLFQKQLVFEANITHNLREMAKEANISFLWEIGDEAKASSLIKKLEKGIELLKSKPEYFKQFNAKNNWGTYKDFIPWLEKLLNACIEHPEATVTVFV